MFDKKGVETIDYTYLQKKGMIKKKPEKELPYKINSSGMIDLTDKTAQMAQSEASSSTNQTGTETSSQFSFLDNLAGSTSSASNNSFTSNENSEPSAEVSAMKIKIDDLEFKLSQLIDKLSLVEDKLANFEKKVVG